jgi:hypothetical protein
MFSYADHLLASGPNSLQRIDEETLFERISRPGAELLALCERLDQLRAISREAYDNHKKKLPFFCGSLFVEDWRQLARFQEAHYFILDLDDCRRSPEQFATLCQRLDRDERVMMRFTSPSRQGLKLVFCLREPIRSAKTYSELYRVFAHRFAQEHGIEDWVDFRTHDATRVCFLAADPEARYNRLCDSVDWRELRSPYDKIAREETPPPAGEAAPGLALARVEESKREKTPPALDTELYQQIRRRLDPNARPARPERLVVIPEVLNDIVEPVNRALSALGFEIVELRDINYGKQWAVKLGLARAEANVFYGKKGFTVKKNDKRGLLPELNELLVDAILSVLYGLERERLPGLPVPGAEGPAAANGDPF